MKAQPFKRDKEKGRRRKRERGEKGESERAAERGRACNSLNSIGLDFNVAVIM